MSLQTPPLEDSSILYEPNLVEQVAKLVAGIAIIGIAARGLQQAGHTAVIASNRITVNDEVEAQLINTNGHTWWQVYSMDGKSPRWLVGADNIPTNWIGADE